MFYKIMNDVHTRIVFAVFVVAFFQVLQECEKVKRSLCWEYFEGLLSKSISFASRTTVL
jgi:hypothetical protein